MSYKPCNSNASSQVQNVLDYLYNLQGRGLICGQHTQTVPQEELCYIKEVTGKAPALCGFELLSYSPNVVKKADDEACMVEIENNKNTLQKAWDWAEKGGLITFTWHWFSPLGGHDKSFFTCNTDFDASKAIIGGTPENKALISDMDFMAGILKEFCDKKIPILWRPFHECDGTWFWWGAKGGAVAKKLYEIMFDRYTNLHKLDNLIWVWNSADSDNYIGDDKCDIVSLDTYLPERTYGDYEDEYNKLLNLTKTDKIKALGEIGPLLSLEKVKKKKIPWTYFMMWSNDFARGDRFTEKSELKKLYSDSFAVTLDKLPKLY